MKAAHNRVTAIGAKVRELRRQANMTQADLADRSGLSERQVANIESGMSSVPTQSTIRLLAGALRVDEQYLAGLVHLGSKPLVALVVSAYETLSENERLALRLHWVEGMTQEAIAVKLGLDVTKAKAIIDGARERLEIAAHGSTGKDSKHYAILFALLAQSSSRPTPSVVPRPISRFLMATITLVGLAMVSILGYRCSSPLLQHSVFFTGSSTAGTTASPGDALVPRPNKSNGIRKRAAIEPVLSKEAALVAFWSSVDEHETWQFGGVLSHLGCKITPENRVCSFRLSTVLETGYAASDGTNIILIWPPEEPQMFFVGIIAAFSQWVAGGQPIAGIVDLVEKEPIPANALPGFIGNLFYLRDAEHLTRTGGTEALTPSGSSGGSVNPGLSFDDRDPTTIVNAICSDKRSPVCLAFAPRASQFSEAMKSPGAKLGPASSRVVALAKSFGSN